MFDLSICFVVVVPSTKNVSLLYGVTTFYLWLIDRGLSADGVSMSEIDALSLDVQV